MQLLVFILAYPFIWLISILPFRLSYLFSDVVFFLVYHVVGYRRKVVRENLQLVFPGKSAVEIKRIEKAFFKHMCDVFLEMVKTMNVSKTEIAKRYRLKNIELIQRIEQQKSILVVCSHYACWEWNMSMNDHIQSKGYAVYQRITNKYFDRWARRVRAKWNTTLITQQETAKTVVRNKQQQITGVFGMVSDQSPQAHRAQYWTEFMGIKVPVINGAETLARKMDLAVVFLKVSKLKRGHYEAEFTTITTAGTQTEKNEITDAFLRMAEQQIYEKPEYYLWTHKRWKHRDKVPEAFASSSNAKNS
ncbi:lipid A biosynthesis acyltransferase [Flavobacteriaceae bacterium TP-CH-4]|uniref:Lipid A biosynthesis acyltransferase n=1 Tax=Pelagihabitans pacificus TaxID=2696054 RepID=A0A967E622_9FLAO|nr:lysophospholipid acyltransferase family protein [Pelagihabitans pacificus]NHF60047.1 lipid A biosynthesis acyltransferase [Pelagihabitans pacificus]